MRQDLTDAYTRKDNKAAHTALGKGLYRVEIPISKELLAQVCAVKSANQQSTTQPQDIKQAVAEKNGYDNAALRRAQIENSFPNNSVPQPIPQPAPTPIKIDRIKPVAEMSSSEKVQEALTRMIPMLPASMRGKVEAMMTPEAIGALTGSGSIKRES